MTLAFKETEGENFPVFIPRSPLLLKNNTRIYVHRSFFSPQELKSWTGTIQISNKAVGYAERLLERNMNQFQGLDYSVGSLWRDERMRFHADMFGFGNIREWPGNPNMYAYTFENESPVELGFNTTCGDTLILLGEEEKQRRRLPTLEEYLKSQPIKL